MLLIVQLIILSNYLYTFVVNFLVHDSHVLIKTVIVLINLFLPMILILFSMNVLDSFINELCMINLTTLFGGFMIN